MGEGSRTTTIESGQSKSTKQKIVLISAGTAAVLLAAAILFQILHPESGEAQVESEAPRGGQQSGVARVSQAERQPVARIGRQLIDYDQVARECFERYGKEVLDKIINRVIIQQACANRGITVTEEEVNQEVIKIAKKFKLSVDQWYQMLQVERNLTPIQYRRDIIWPMLALKKLAGTEVEVSKADLAKAFERDFGPKVRARMIMLDNFRRATEVWEKANRNPDEFDSLVREYSIEPNSRALGGVIPPIRKHSGNETLENAAFKLRQGEISPVIQIGPEIQPRYVILLCEGHTDWVVKDINEVYDELHAQLVQEKTQESVAKVFERIKEEARVDNYLTNTSSGGDVEQTSGTARPVQPGGAGRTRGAATPFDSAERPQRNRRR